MARSETNGAQRDCGPGETGPERSYWRKTRALTLSLFLIWMVATFGFVFFARELSAWSFFGWPLSFYLAAQGTPAIFLVIVWYYARTMNRIDDEMTASERAE